MPLSWFQAYHNSQITNCWNANTELSFDVARAFHQSNSRLDASEYADGIATKGQCGLLHTKSVRQEAWKVEVVRTVVGKKWPYDSPNCTALSYFMEPHCGQLWLRRLPVAVLGWAVAEEDARITTTTTPPSLSTPHWAIRGTPPPMSITGLHLYLFTNVQAELRWKQRSTPTGQQVCYLTSYLQRQIHYLQGAVIIL